MNYSKLTIQNEHLDTLLTHNHVLRKSKGEQIEKAKRFLTNFGFVFPIVTSKDYFVLIGDPFLTAAKELDYELVPIVKIDYLTETEERALRIAFSRILEEEEWDYQALKIELEELKLIEPDIDLTVTGFSIPEIDFILHGETDDQADPLDNIPTIEKENPIVNEGDLYELGDHLLFCGDALEEESYKYLLGNTKASMVFTDAPYNVKIDGHVGNSGEIQHREFKMASGEMSVDEFTVFLTKAHHHMSCFSKKGAILFSCMDWRHINEMLMSAQKNKLEFKNLCVWAKDNGGMGSLYRSQHELIFVFKKTGAKHINNVELGKHGRYRTNVWQYPGVNSFSGNRMDELKLHPTVKPTQMVVDAILDCSNPKDIILDPFGGSGTTLMAAEKVDRKARLIELDPLYCDVIVRRFEEATGKKAFKRLNIHDDKTMSVKEA